MNNSFLANVQVEGQEAQDLNKHEQVEETPAESLAENKPQDVPPSPEGGESKDAAIPKEGEAESKDNSPDATNQIPFNKHPRWLEMLEERNALREQVAALAERVDKVQSVSETKSPEVEALPKWFAEIYGDNLDAWKDYQSHLDSELQKRQANQQAQTEAKRRQEASEADRWSKWVEDSVQKIEAKNNVDLPKGSSERNEFMAYVLKVKPTDDEGNIDLITAWNEYSEKKELLKLRDLQKSEARKDVASISSPSASKNEPAKEEYVTLSQMRRRSFQDLIR